MDNEIPKWYQTKYSDLINLPNYKDKQLHRFNNNDLLKQNSKCYSFNNVSNISKYITPNKVNNTEQIITKYNSELKKKIEDIENNASINDKNIKIKTLITKTEKKMKTINTVTKCFKYSCKPNKKQKDILFKWFNECDKVYNFCVNYYNKCIKEGQKEIFLLNNYMKMKIIIFNELYGNNKKEAPYDVLTDEVRAFCSNLKSCFSNLKNGNIKHFEMSEKKNNNTKCILIPKPSVNKNGFYTSILKKMKMQKIKNINLMESDCRLLYDKIKKEFTLLVPTTVKIKNIENREKIVALDPGEKIFQTFYGTETYGYLGSDMRKPILEIEKKIRKIQRILSKGLNKRGQRIRNKKRLHKKLDEYYKKINNKVKDLHNKTALYLCQNYEKIIIPTFETQKMVKNEMKRKIRETKKEKIKGCELKEEIKKILNDYNKKRRLNGRTKFVLNMLSHYKFREHLLNKSQEYGSEVIIMTEEYTSQTCTFCGRISNNYKNREKECEKCGKKINRDINGARNILIKSISERSSDRRMKI